MTKAKINENDIQDYTFQSFTEMTSESDVVESFELKELDGKFNDFEKNKVNILRQEKKNAMSSGFKIDTEVSRHRGIDQQAHTDRENIISEEIEKRMVAIEKEAFQKGYQDGLEKGKEEVYKELISQTEEKVQLLNDVIMEALSLREDLLSKQKDEVYRTIKGISKWVIAKELSDDGEYIHRLLENLISEMQCKGKILIKINPVNFQKMPEILKFMEEKFESIQNVKVEMDTDVDNQGIVLESDNGIIDGNLSKQFDAIDKIFERVGIPVEENVVPKIETKPPQDLEETDDDDNIEED